MKIVLWIIAGIIVLSLLYNLFSAGIGLLFWLTVALVIGASIVAGVHQWWIKSQQNKPTKTFSERQVEQAAARELKKLEQQVEEKPTQQTLRR
jgi:hypothetical protein